MSLKMEIMVPLHYGGGNRGSIHKVKAVSCMAGKLAMPQERKTNFYEVLSLGSEKVGFEEIKKAYRAMALQYHPDVCPPSTKEESTRRFVELREAYETLSDPVSRRIYDCELGLVESSGFSVRGAGEEERRSRFAKEVWEKQLAGLRKRSDDRMMRRKKTTII
ncbi:chaperone protein dnaJ 20, chloroplastic-like [Diospyros lotus]|uniref:chaperone protein dnaJ 20, chloroplastic-like n=1 Tax=Diospyros lotus TaxID=55363 RepID=UPI00224CE33F|nr:chaperone protein dnaJ 20, chloroplastic-like [Diospyros lotus]